MSSSKNPPRVPIMYFPLVGQALFRSNAERIKDKPYAKYFSGDMRIHEEVVPHLRQPMDPADMLSSRPEDINTLLDPGYHRTENGFGITEDGHPYVAALTPFPGCTAEMFMWWFWWHSVEPERYSLWHPYAHVQSIPINQDVLTRPGLSDAERCIGNTHRIKEYIGPFLLETEAKFADASELGFDTSRFEEAGYRAYATAAIDGGVMIHLARDTADGFELRSRFIMDRQPAVAPNDVATRQRSLGMAHELFFHCVSEFTHLSTFLADIYSEFGAQRP